MEQTPQFSNCSLASVRLEMIFSPTGLSFATGTAFFYRKGTSVFLITNWHNVTGINPRTKKPIGKNAGRPDLIRFKLFKKNQDEFTWYLVDVRLYSDDDMENPYWLVHPAYREQVDVIALEINIPPGLELMAITDKDLNFKDFKPGVADEVFILGFPYNISQMDVFPIWKRASIATEPEYGYEDKPMMLVDTASRSGMSGSPVILKRNGIWREPNLGFGTRTCFLGIYSGRILGETELEAQLGIVWSKNVIEEIINGNERDSLKSFA